MDAARRIDPPATERLYSSCLFCGHRFPSSPLFGSVPPGHQLAYDPVRNRLWSICVRCRRWNLVPVEERFDAIDLLERTVSGRADLVSSSDNIALYSYEALQIIRIGGARLVERSSWRYGSYGARAAAIASANRRSEAFAAAAVEVVERVGTVPGLRLLNRHIDGGRALDMVRWSRFGRLAWAGSAPCSHCSSVLHALHFDVSWWLYPRIERSRLVVGVPCTRCDPWTPANVFDLTGDDAHLVLRRVLAYQHLGAGRQRAVTHAAEIVQRAGTADRALHEISTGRSSLWGLGLERRIALEIALDHLADTRASEARLDGFASEWRVENELAGIVDDELS
jgi:hypothetical protein